MSSHVKRRGNCYVTVEALWHLLGGPRSPWRVMRMRWGGDTHWFLMRGSFDDGPPPVILDPTRRQFKRPPTRYHYRTRAVGTGFLTRRPSKRAREMMERMVWQ